MANILLIGKFPPPFGGVSVYVQRRYAQLLRQGDNVCFQDTTITTSNILTLFHRLLFKHFDVIEINSLKIPLLFILYLCGNLKKVVVIDHNHSRHFAESNFFSKKLLRFILCRVGHIGLVRNSIAENYRHIGLMNYKFDLASPFIPPDESLVEGVLASWPVELHTIIANKSATVFFCSASIVDLDKDHDLYGFLECLEAMHVVLSLSRNNGKKPLLLLVASVMTEQSKLKIQQKIRDLSLSDNVLLLVGSWELWPIYVYVDIFLRPTLTDGDSVSVREALFFNCPVVATDVVQRPEGVLVYKRGDVATLVHMLDGAMPEGHKLLHE